MPNKLPAEWAVILDEVDRSLQLRLSQLDDQEKTNSARDDAEPVVPRLRADLDERSQDVAKLTEMTSAFAAVLGQADAALAEVEAELRLQGQQSEGVRLKLASWAGRAIG